MLSGMQQEGPRQMPFRAGCCALRIPSLRKTEEKKKPKAKKRTENTVPLIITWSWAFFTSTAKGLKYYMGLEWSTWYMTDAPQIFC